MEVKRKRKIKTFDIGLVLAMDNVAAGISLEDTPLPGTSEEARQHGG